MRKYLHLLIRVIFIILITYLQVYGLFYFVGFDLHHWVMVAATLFPLLMMNIYFIRSFFSKKHTSGEIIKLFILAFAFYVGLFLPYLNSFSTKYLISVLGYISLFFVMGYLSDELLLKAQWKAKNRKVRLIRPIIYFVIPASAYAFFLTASYPGLFSPDSLYILNVAQNGGPYDNLSPLLYTLVIRLLTIIGLKIGGMMILQALMCAAAYAYIVYSFDKLGLPIVFCVLGSIALTFYPINLMNSITMWKDIPFTIGLSVITTELVKLSVLKDYFKSKWNLSVLSLAIVVTLISRHNGIMVIALTLVAGGLYFLIKKNKQYALTFAILLASSAVFYYSALYGSMALLGDKYQEPEDNQVTKTAFFALRVQGLIAVYYDKSEELTPDEINYIDKYLDLDEVDAHIEKYSQTWRYRSRTKIYVDAQALLNNKKDFNKGYIRLLKKYPFEVINAYLKTTGIVWAAPSYGYTMHSAYPHQYYDFSTYPNLEMQIKNYLPAVKDFMISKIYKKIAEYKHYAIFWRPALFMLILILFLYHALKKHGGAAWVVAAPAIFNSLGYLIVNEAQDARYVYINFAAALIMIAFSLIKHSKKETQK